MIKQPLTLWCLNVFILTLSTKWIYSFIMFIGASMAIVVLVLCKILCIFWANQQD